jgi:hypothetical protein
VAGHAGGVAFEDCVGDFAVFFVREGAHSPSAIEGFMDVSGMESFSSL